MKKFLYLLMIPLCLGMTACSGDDDDDKEKSITVTDLEGCWLMPSATINGSPAFVHILFRRSYNNKGGADMTTMIKANKNVTQNSFDYELAGNKLYITGTETFMAGTYDISINGNTLTLHGTSKTYTFAREESGSKQRLMANEWYQDAGTAIVSYKFNFSDGVQTYRFVSSGNTRQYPFTYTYNPSTCVLNTTGAYQDIKALYTVFFDKYLLAFVRKSDGGIGVYVLEKQL